MKTLLAILFLAICLEGSTKRIDNDPIKCDIYKVTVDSGIVKIHQVVSDKRFLLTFEKNSRYILYFSSKIYGEKIMCLESSADTDFSIDVDFKNKKSAFVSYNTKEKKYIIRHMSDEQSFQILETIKNH